ncbi:hypothetical protein [Streptomyces sp. NPDC127072]|uniref:VMAP-C domain-containing protein n=1 Tax=Streptomyces sp. NPDC127072 TaxID=3347129 RepID=UPI0036644858
MTSDTDGPSQAFGCSGGQWSEQALRRLQEAFTGFDEVCDNPDFLRQVLRNANRQLKQADINFVVAHRPNPRDRVDELVNTLRGHAERDRVLQALRSAMEALRHDLEAMVVLNDVVDELLPAGRLSSVWLRHVEYCLNREKISAGLADEALYRALLPGEPTSLRGSESVPVMVRRLHDSAGGGAGWQFPAETTTAAITPLVLRFLAELAALLPQDSQEVLRQHVRYGADDLQLPAQERDALLQRKGRRLAPIDSRVLQIRLREKGPGKGQYWLDGAVFDCTRQGLRNLRKCRVEQPVSANNLREIGRTCLDDWQELTTCLDEVERPLVEFLLPWSLLGQPVDRWLTDGAESLVGHRYPVVVRSLDRLENRAWRTAWEQRWRLLHSGNAQSRLGHDMRWLTLDENAHFRPTGDVLFVRGLGGEVRAWLDKRPESTGLGLAFAYDPGHERSLASLKEALREGVPFVVWRRDGGDPQELAEQLAAKVEVSLLDLPDEIRRWRRAALDHDMADLRNHLTLLWDNPEHTAESGTSAIAPSA